jgi:hypothetical protein
MIPIIIGIAGFAINFNQYMEMEKNDSLSLSLSLDQITDWVKEE